MSCVVFVDVQVNEHYSIIIFTKVARTLLHNNDLVDYDLLNIFLLRNSFTCFTDNWCFSQDVPPFGRNMKTPTNKDTKDKSDDGVDGFEEEDEGGVGEEIRERNNVEEEHQSTNLMDDL